MIGREARLRVGDVVEFERAKWRVDLVTFCAARCVPLSRREVTINGRSFRAPGKVTYISTDAEVPVLKRRKKGGR